MSVNHACPCTESCPLQKVSETLGGKWKFSILCSLSASGATRYNDLKRKIKGIGVTVDYVLADSVSDNDSNLLAQFRQITDNQPLERKQLAIKVLRLSLRILMRKKTGSHFNFTFPFRKPLIKSTSSSSRSIARLTSKSADISYSAESVCSLSYCIESLN